MDDGIYILKTLDGYRVAYSTDYHLIVDLTENCEYVVNGQNAKNIFKHSRVYKQYEDALKQAKILLLKHGETEDGICLISYAQHFNYEDLTNEKNS